MKVGWRDRLVYVCGRAALGLAASAPEWLAYGLAAALGRLYIRCSRRRREAGLRFLRLAYPDRPEAELLRLARIATGNIFKVPVDIARVTRLIERGGDLTKVVDMSQAASMLPKAPYLALTAHLGSWEMAAVSMAHLEHGAHAVARTFRNPLLQRWILQNRERYGLRIHPRRGGIRELASAVAAGSVGLLVVDQHQRLRGVMAPFFGRICSCERAAVSLALRRGYPVLVGVALRVGRGFRFRLMGLPPFVPAVTGDKPKDLEQAVVEVNARLEQHIRACPEQYLWIHDRFRARPDVGAAAGVDGADAVDTDAGED